MSNVDPHAFVDPEAPIAPEAERPTAGLVGGLAGAEQTDFAAPRPLRADVWRRFQQNKLAMAGLIFIVLICLVAVFAPWIAPYGFDERTPGAFREGPSSEHWFGTDIIGLDIFSRVVYGARISLRVGFIATGHGAGHRPGPGRHRRVRRRPHRQPDHALHRHLPGHPVHHPGHRGGHDLRPERQLGDPGAGSHRAGWASVASSGPASSPSAGSNTWRRRGPSGSAARGSSSGTCCPTPCSR